MILGSSLRLHGLVFSSVRQGLGPDVSQAPSLADILVTWVPGLQLTLPLGREACPHPPHASPSGDLHRHPHQEKKIQKVMLKDPCFFLALSLQALRKCLDGQETGW